MNPGAAGVVSPAVSAVRLLLSFENHAEGEAQVVLPGAAEEGRQIVGLEDAYVEVLARAHVEPAADGERERLCVVNEKRVARLRAARSETAKQRAAREDVRERGGAHAISHAVSAREAEQG